jgi:polyphosphate kinase 2 (PPK2 family)
MHLNKTLTMPCNSRLNAQSPWYRVQTNDKRAARLALADTHGDQKFLQNHLLRMIVFLF